MSTEPKMKSWFTATLNTVNETLVDHRTALQQLLTAMEQESYVDALQLHQHDLMGVQEVLDEAHAALGDAFSRLTATADMVDSTPRMVPAVRGSRLAKPHINNAIHFVEAGQESVKRINTRVRAMAVHLTSKTTSGMVGAEVTTLRGLLAEMFPVFHNALVSIADARAQFN